MRTSPSRSHDDTRPRSTPPTVIIVGGHGGMSARYRQIVEARGWQMRHFENKMPAGVRRNLGKIALVIVVANMVSHSLRQQVFDSIGPDVRIVYLGSPSATALRSALPDMARAA